MNKTQTKLIINRLKTQRKKRRRKSEKQKSNYCNKASQSN